MFQVNQRSPASPSGRVWSVIQFTSQGRSRQSARGVGIYGISHCYLTKPTRTGFILGYSRMNQKQIREGIAY